MLTGGDESDPTVRLWDSKFDEKIKPDNQLEKWVSNNHCADCELEKRLQLRQEEILRSEEYQQVLFQPSISETKKQRGRKNKKTIGSKNNKQKEKKNTENNNQSEECLREEFERAEEKRQQAYKMDIYEKFPLSHGGAIRIFHRHENNKNNVFPIILFMPVL